MTFLLKRCSTFFLILWCYSIQGQIVLTPTAGCIPLSVQFSGPPGATGVHWNLGNGITALAAPSSLYSSPGQYVISYTAMVNGSPVSYTASLSVFSPPQASYSSTVPATRCKPVVVPFKGSGGAPGSTYRWAFGDLSSLVVGSAVSHTYSSAGSYTPVMIVTDAVSGCTAVAQSSAVVNVSDPAMITIQGNPGLSACSNSLTTFISASLSTSGSPLTSSFSAVTWTLSQGTPALASGLDAGTVTFQQGQHTVMVSMTDDNNCTTTASSPVTVSQPSLSVAAKSVSCWGDTLEWMPYSSEPIVHLSGPGGFSYTYAANQLPYDSVYYLTTPGVNIFTASIYPSPPCAAMSQTFAVFAESVSVTYVADTSASCAGSLAVTYSAQATSNYSGSTSFSYAWLSNPLGFNVTVPQTTTGAVVNFTFYQGPSRNPYTVYKEWRPMPLVHVTSPYGCHMNYANDIFAMLHRPTAWFSTDLKDGCAPLEVTFRDSSTTSYLFPLSHFTLFTGVGTNSLASTSFSLFPYTYTYTAPGTYSAYMIVKTANGCIDTSFFHPITPALQPTVGMAMSSSSVCAGQSVQINMTVQPSSLTIQHWNVMTNGNAFHGCINDASPVSYFNNPGPQTLTLQAVHNGCEGSTIVPNALDVLGPTGTFRIKMNCTPGTQRLIEFYVRLQDADNAVLDFGDGNTASVTGSLNSSVSHILTHSYTTSGNYTVSLTSYNATSGCAPRVFTLEVTPRQLVPKITMGNKLLSGTSDTLALWCEGQRFLVEGDKSEDERLACTRGYLWALSMPGYKFPGHDSASTPKFLDDTLVAGNIYRLVLRIKDVNECVASDTIHFRMSKAIPNFSFSANPLCLSAGTVQLINHSQSFQHPHDSITASMWNFGNLTLPYQPVNPLENPVATYSFASAPFQKFMVVLSATNNVGCTGTYSTELQVNNPLPGLQPSTYYPCVPKNASFPVVLSGLSGYASYTFSPGVPGINTLVTTQHSMSVPFYTPGIFASTLTVADNAGCRAQEQVTVHAIGQATPEIVLLDSISSFCKPAVPVLDSKVHTYQTVFTNTLWSVGNKTTPPPGMPTFSNYIFTSAGTHTVTLRINYNGYCEASTQVPLLVADPHAGLKLNSSQICLGDTLKVNVTDSMDVFGWRWYFGDLVPQNDIYAGGFLAKFYPSYPYHYTIAPYDSAGRTTVAIRYFGSQGACVRTATAALQVMHFNTTFAEKDGLYRICLNRQAEFIASTKNNFGLQFLYNWNFGDNNTGTGQSINHTYKEPGVYQVTLQTRDATIGCKDTTTGTMTVLPLPEAQLHVSRPLICPGDTLTLVGSGKPGVSGSLSGTLTPAHSFSFTSSNDFSVQTTAAQTTSYSLTVSDENNCESEPVVDSVSVQQKPSPTVWDTTIIVGQTVILNPPSGSNFTYSWLPPLTGLDCDTCLRPIVNTSVSAVYTVMLTDQPLGCFTTGHVFHVNVLPMASLDVPTAFTPNGDGINDVIFPDGWALKRLKYFRVYNRWGQLIYETTDLKKGWDGTFNGEPQNMETYVYQVAAETLLDTVLTKSGSFKLLR